MKKTLAALLFFAFFQLNAQQTVGVFINDSLAFDGYTLFTPSSYKETKLIDNCGRVVNTWYHDTTPGLSVYLLENGNLLRTNRVSSGKFGGGGSGGRITIQDWDSNTLWDYIYSDGKHHHHHDVEYMPNGNVLILAWEAHTYEEAIEMGRDSAAIGQQLWTEQIVEVQPIGLDSGLIVWEWHLKDHLIQDYDNTRLNFGVVVDHPEKIDFNFFTTISPDWVHLNSVDYNPDLDQIMVDSRHLSELWVIDHSTTSEEAASDTGGNSGKGGDILYRWGNPAFYDRGTAEDKKLFGPHDCHWIPAGLPDEGKIMCYNNGQNRAQGNYSTIDVIAPPMDEFGNYLDPNGIAYGPENTHWTYPEIPDPQFFSSNISGAQRMPNGNTLICEGASGHLFEVDSQGELVWDYINPLTAFGATEQTYPPNANSVFRCYRYGADFLGLAGQDLTPGEVIELNPIPTPCDTIISATNWLTVEERPTINGNMVGDQLVINNPTGQAIFVQLYDLVGRPLVQQKMVENNMKIVVNHLPTGIYLLSFATENNSHIFTQKILKK